MKELLESKQIPCLIKNKEELQTVSQVNINKVMWYGLVTALSKVHKIDGELIKRLTNDVLICEYLEKEEKVKFLVDILIHNFLVPFHSIKKNEKIMDWKLFEEILEKSNYLQSKFSDNWVKRKSMIKGIFMIRIAIKHLENDQLNYFGH